MIVFIIAPLRHFTIYMFYHHSTIEMRKMCYGTKYTVEQGKTVDGKWSKKMVTQNQRK